MTRTRLNWDDYFMIQAIWAKVRSPDINTQHGCVIVDKRHRQIGQGYNGYPSNVNDAKMPQTRPEKYGPILHSEENAILNSTGDLDGATLYVTGPPCIHCWAHIIQVGIRRVVYGPTISPKESIYNECKSLHTANTVIDDMLEGQYIESVKWVPNNPGLIEEELDVIQQLV